MERWKDIPGYEGKYKVSSLGNVKNVRTNKLLKSRYNRGYNTAILYGYKSNTKTYKVHRLVMMAFIGFSELEVNHKDGIKDNNCLENLEYVTRSENIKHSYRALGHKINLSSLGKKGGKSFAGKSIIQMDILGNVIKIWDTITEASDNLGISKSLISLNCSGKRLSAKGYNFKFYNI